MRGEYCYSDGEPYFEVEMVLRGLLLLVLVAVMLEMCDVGIFGSIVLFLARILIGFVDDQQTWFEMFVPKNSRSC